MDCQIPIRTSSLLHLPRLAIDGAVLPSKFTCLFRNEDAVPPSATTTEFTTDGETVEIAGGQVEYVKTGERGGARLVEA